MDRCPSAAPRGSRQLFLTRDQPSSSDWIQGPCARRLSPVTADVIAGWVYSTRSASPSARRLSSLVLPSSTPASRVSRSFSPRARSSTLARVRGPAEHRAARIAASTAGRPASAVTRSSARRDKGKPISSRARRAAVGGRLKSPRDRRTHALGTPSGGLPLATSTHGTARARGGSRSVLSRVKVAVRSHACWTFSSTRAPLMLSRPPISAPSPANRDGQPYTGPGFARINSDVTFAAPKRAAAVASETRNVPGSRSCGPSRSQIGRRPLRRKAAARSSVGRLSSATS